MKNQNIVIMVLLAVVFAGAGFFAGTKYQQSQSPAPGVQMAGQFGNRAGGTGTAGGTRGMAARGGQVLGTILSVGNNSITVQLADGSSKILLIGGTTTIGQMTAATASDLKVGTRVSAFGTTNTDGSVTAQSIQINPVMRQAGAPSGTPSGMPVKQP
jgi:hypothetical protein